MSTHSEHPSTVTAPGSFRAVSGRETGRCICFQFCWGSYCAVRLDRTQHLDTLQRGFEILSVAAGIVIAIQSQILGTTFGISRDEETILLRTVNVLFFSGLVLDIMSAGLAFLTSRWLQRLTLTEKAFLEEAFAFQESQNGGGTRNLSRLPAIIATEAVPPKSALNSRLAISFFARSLFVPFPLLLAGTGCMVVGLLVYIWAQHALVVAILVTLTFISTLPFLFAVFLIGQDQQRRKEIIIRLSRSQGDW